MKIAQVSEQYGISSDTLPVSPSSPAPGQPVTAIDITKEIF
jgi:hypothetical protein